MAMNRNGVASGVSSVGFARTCGVVCAIAAQALCAQARGETRSFSAHDEPLVVIDPGHGGAEGGGAQGVCGVHERDVALAVAKELRALLLASGRARVVLTRERDEAVPLAERAKQANALGAALFLSIHANASKNPKARGVETFFLSTRAANRRIARLVARENANHRPQQARSEPLLNTILGGLRLDAAHRESQRLAMILQGVLHREVGARSRGVLQAPFAVLRGAQMAAALVEVGFVTHAEECVLLGSIAHQRRIAQSLTTAVLSHLDEGARWEALRRPLPLTSRR